MINLYCDQCKSPDSQLQIRTEEHTIVIECLECGDIKRFKKNNMEIKK